MKILIENGHGIDTKGKRGPDGRLLEYTQNRLLAGRIVTALQARGLDASLLVPEEADIPLPERCRRVNEWCHQLVKIQLTAPGRCRHLGILRNYLVDEDCAAGVVSVVIPGYAGVWGFDLDQFQVYARFIQKDSITGYRSQYHECATLIRATEGTAIGPASQED